jgi:hypothetical protein
MEKENSPKIIHCSNRNCRQPLGKMESGSFIVPENEQVFSKGLAEKKKKANPLYCVHCRRYTRWYKEKFVSKPKLKKRGK